MLCYWLIKGKTSYIRQISTANLVLIWSCSSSKSELHQSAWELINYYSAMMKNPSAVNYRRVRPPPPYIPASLPSSFPSRQCIPIPHTVAVSSGESCLLCATGPTKRCRSRASPHRPEAEQTHGRHHRRAHRGNLLYLFDRVALVSLHRRL